MHPFFEGALQAAASLNFQFVAYLLMGLAVGWLLDRPGHVTEAFATLALVGVCGAWLGAEFAYLFGQAPRGSAHQLVAALIGAVILAYAWRRLHPATEPLQFTDSERR